MSDAWSTSTRFGDTGSFPTQDVLSQPPEEWDKSHGHPVDLITVSREFGAGGSDLARALGAYLHWSVLDRELVCQVAERLRLDPRHVEPLDEQPPSFLARLVASTLLMTPPEMHLELEAKSILNPDSVAEAARTAILAAAQSPPLVVVGHGAQCLFRDRPATLHVRLIAPLASRVDRICVRDTCNRAAAAAIARRMDDARRAYVRRHYHADVHDPMLYDVQINTGRVSIGEAAEYVAALVLARRGEHSTR